MKQGTKLGIGIAFVIVLLVVAFFRVAPYVQGARPTELEESKRRISEVVVSAVPPVYDQEGLQDGADDLAIDIRNTTKRALLELPKDALPTEAAAREIARVYSEFVMLNRLGTLQDKLASCRERGVNPHPALLRKDASRSEAMWGYSTSWAKHAPLDLGLVRVVPRYLEGQVYSSSRGEGGGINARPLSTGNKLLYDGAGNFTVYEVVLPVLMPSIDGESEFEVDICTSIVNDRPDGSWDVVSLTWSRKPKDAVCVLPYP